MKYHAFYIDGNLLIKIKDKECTDYEKKENVVILYHDKEVIGYNILNYQFVGINEGLVKLNEEINSDINQRIQKVGQKPLEFDLESDFVVGKIVDIKKHPESEKLSICQVELKDKVVQIVCGASNVELNRKVVVAKPGTVLFNGKWIHQGKVLGIESQGMICNVKELNIAKEANGVLLLDDKYEVGANFFAKN